MATDDDFLWLEEIEGEKALAWVRGQNERTLGILKAEPTYDAMFSEALAILTSKERLALGALRKDVVDNFWQDETNVRGLWRRASLASFRAGQPEWQTVLDIDALARTEKENWVYKGVNCLPPAYDRCMVNLSPGGTDAGVAREFSVSEKRFIADGFVIPKGKNGYTWLDADTLLVSADWGGGRTESGYARDVRLWKRGTPFSAAERIHESPITDVVTSPVVLRHKEETATLIVRRPTFFSQQVYRWQPNEGLKPLPLPKRIAMHGLFGRQIVVTAREAWTHGGQTVPAGALIAVDIDRETVSTIFVPADKQAIAAVRITESSIVIAMLEDVVGRIKRFRFDSTGWTATDVALPDRGVVRFAGTSSSFDGFFVVFESMTQPQSLYFVEKNDAVEPVTGLPAFFDASDVRVEQHFATSRDGTRVPYFVMGRTDVLSKGPAPTIQYGYGGFSIPILPVYYSDPARPQHGALAGKLWIQRGGVLVLSNIRGGGEYGPKWHQAALKAERQRAFEDFFAIAEDLIRREVTTPKMLGAIGRSNGGLLMGAALTQRPDLYAAIDCGVPLFDMQRYDKLLAGASWVAEYGDPDTPQEWAFISKYSPYHRLQAERPYPEVLFYTSTKDDRVHPGHARRAAAKLLALGYSPLYYENIEGGHGGTSNQDQLAMRTALEFAYFARRLMLQN